MYNYHNRDSFGQQSNERYRISVQQPRVRQTVVSNNSKSKVQDGHKTYQQKIKALGRVRYLNPLAQLEYEQKLTELHTKYSSRTKQSVQKKLKARNQIAQFIDQQQQQFGQQFEQLMDYKYGASKWKDFHFERESSAANKQYSFCPLCDQVHTLSQSEHQSSCKYIEYVRSPKYYLESLDRIKASLSRFTSQQAVQLSNLTERIKKRENVTKQLLEIMPYVKEDDVFGKIAAKLQQIIQSIF